MALLYIIPVQLLFGEHLMVKVLGVDLLLSLQLHFLCHLGILRIFKIKRLRSIIKGKTIINCTLSV